MTYDTDMLTLDTAVEDVPKIGPAYQKKLKKLGINHVRDLLYYFPQRYDDFSNIIPISQARQGNVVCVQGRIIAVEASKSVRKWMNIITITIEDETGTINATWFNQPYLAQSLKQDDTVCLAGKVSLNQDGLFLNSPAHERLGEFSENEDLVHTGRIVPVYAETKGLTSRWLRYIIKPLLIQFHEVMPESLPEELLEKHKFLPINEALWQVHFPESFEAADAAKARFSFEELLVIQLSVLKERAKLLQRQAPQCPIDEKLMQDFVASLPFTLTDSQKQCAWQILKDMEKTAPMSRLLEGDVGSGKTVVAAMAALSAIKNNHQVAFMAPTEILAKQHYKGLQKMLEKFEVTVGLLTSKERFLGGKEVTKKTFITELKQGTINLVIGTHAIISKGIEFNNLALVVLDEQHRFGVNQRMALVSRSTQINTQIDADDNEKEFLYADLTYKVRGAIFDVYNTLGSGQKEVIYQRALEEKLKTDGLIFEREKLVPISYNGKKIGTYQPDFIIEDKIILELKALSFIGPTEKKQAWSYLKGSSYKLAFLVNFGPKLAIERIIFDVARNQRTSAFHQRESAKEMRVPHLLSMTATPIPRTLALTIYGDLDLSLIKEMPKDRKPIKTIIVEPNDRQVAYDFIAKEVKEGKGVFVICPKIEARSLEVEAGMTNSSRALSRVEGFVPQNYSFGLDTTQVKSVTEEYEKLSKDIFPDFNVTMMHGRMKPAEKEKIMVDFKNGEIDILISTSVVEVGVDVPRATVMMIEGAERFGLAQLHQFRGRVGRSNMQSYCFLFTTSPDQLNRKRLKALVESNNGFELAQKDLEIRGPGQLYGTDQWGLPDMAMEGISNIFLVEKTRAAAKGILEKDLALENLPELKERVKKLKTKIHFE